MPQRHHVSIRYGHHKKHTVWPWIVGILATVIALLVALGVSAGKLIEQSRQVQDHENKALSMMSGLSGDFADSTVQELSKSLSGIQAETKAANDITHSSLWDFYAKLPYVGQDIATVQGMTEVVKDITNESIAGFVDVLDTLQKTDLVKGDGISLQPIADVQPKLNAANKSLQMQVTKYNSLKQPNIAQIGKAYQNGKGQLNNVAGKIDALANTFNMLPAFLGSEQPSNYAVMAMTTSEMRSSGGLIGSIGELTAVDGEIHIKDFRSNTEYLEYGSGAHSEDMKRVFSDEGPLHMSFDVRDLAVFPDTAQTAQAMQSIWQRTPWGRDNPLSGVIVVDPVFVQQLAEIVGKVTLPDGTILDGTNTAEYLLNGVYKQYAGHEGETDLVFGVVATQVINDMFKNLSVGKLAKVGEMLGTMAKERHFSMYDFNSEREKIIQNAGFTASIPDDGEHPTVGVYLTEQNPSKLGWYLKRNATISTIRCDDSGKTIYHIEYALDNTLSESDASQLTEYMGGVGDTHGIGIEKILFYPPQGGSISNLTLINDTTNSIREDLLDGRKVYRSTVRIAPEQRVIFTFDVTVSDKARTRLTVDQTPMGWIDDGVKYEGSSCPIK